MPNLTLPCPNTGEPFDLGMAILPAASLTLTAFPVTCDQCGEVHMCVVEKSRPALAAAAVEQA